MTSPSLLYKRLRQTRRALGWLGPWIALASLALWTALPGFAPLLLAAAGVTSAVLWGPRRRGPSWGSGSIVLVFAILAGFGAHRQVGQLESGWVEYWETRELEVEQRLDQAVQQRLASAEEAADSLASLASGIRADPELTELRTIQRLRERFGAAAVALYGPSGELIIWDGVHRGSVPEEAQSGAERYMYRDLPLFGYLYVTAIAADGSVAVVAHLLRSDVSPALEADLGDFASEFSRSAGEAITISRESPLGPRGVFDLVTEDDVRLLSVVVDRPERDDRIDQVMGRWRGVVSVAVVLAWLLLAMGGPPRMAAGAMAAGGLLFIAGLLPFERIDGLAHLFDPALFALPGPIPISLGRFALLTLAGLTAVAVLPRPRLELPAWAAGAVVGVGFLLVTNVVANGVLPLGLAEGRLVYVVYNLAVACVLTLLVGSALAFSKAQPGSARYPATAGLVSALVLSAIGGVLVTQTATLPLWWPALWAVPTAAVALSMRAWPGWQRPLVSWLAAGVLASSAALPTTWSHRIESRIEQGTQLLSGLAASEDPELERGLIRLGAIADTLERSGKSPVDIMYGAWRRSGLSDAGAPLRLTMWTSDGQQGEELRIGARTELPPFMTDLVLRAQDLEVVRVEPMNRDDARYVMSVPLSGGGLLTVIAPPIDLDPSRSPLSALMGAAIGDLSAPVTLIPLLDGDPHGGRSLAWLKTGSGWQGEIAVQFQNATYDAHHLVDLPVAILATARGALLLTLNLVVFFTFWLGGRALLRDVVPPEMRLSGLVISFRARVTLALFGFFVLANALFGTLAYRTLAQASARSARVIAERVVEDAAGWYLSLEVPPGTRMDRLADQVRAELLEYRDGELRGGGSVAELVELGLYEGWMPMTQHRLLDGREGISEFTETSQGRWRYVTAYRRLPDGDILGAQVPIQAGTTAIRTTDMIELLGLAVLVGGALSLVLAWMAGRALTSPIRALQTASEGVGAGDLGMRLPSSRTDEFGAVFRAFNRMVGRVRRARRQLVRTSRRTQAIMDEAAVGMIALDPAGRVLLVNPSAEELLGTEVFVGRSVPTEGPTAEALSQWVASFIDGSAEESNTELHSGDRRIRVRVTRLGSFGTRRGVVVAMDDVTDELRTERVLAWGEMARQVAHEVKNPLTPIKLSIQHIRRAWNDEREDFDEILVKNADAMLAEIDRLAAIAASFSRFGAPGGHGETPLSPVSVEALADDVMTLYGGEQSISPFSQRVEPDLPDVSCRPEELKEVLINLLENAREAIQEGGAVTIEGRMQDDAMVTIDVVDDGAGIPEDVLARIFEPRFSTRSKGAGLGLPIVQRLVATWGGSVSVASEVGVGTTVSLHVPVWVAPNS
jgi:PAS domain S-box-containing protein